MPTALDSQIISDAANRVRLSEPQTTEVSTLTPGGQLLVQMQNAVTSHFASQPVLNAQNFAHEVAMVARLAVAEGQYKAAHGLYSLFAEHQKLTGQNQQLHQHVHLHNGQPTDATAFARATDDELRRIIAEVQQTRNTQTTN